MMAMTDENTDIVIPAEIEKEVEHVFSSLLGDRKEPPESPVTFMAVCFFLGFTYEDAIIDEVPDEDLRKVVKEYFDKGRQQRIAEEDSPIEDEDDDDD